MIYKEGDELVIKDPPPKNWGKWQRFATRLEHECPDRWVLVADDINAAELHGNLWRSLRNAGLEVTVRQRKVKTKTYIDVYARFALNGAVEEEEGV